MTLPHVPRRSLFSLAALGAGAGIAGSLSLPSVAHADSRDHSIGYGPLVVDPKGLIDLPAGFSYNVLAISNAVLANGVAVAPTTPTVPGSPMTPEPPGEVRRHCPSTATATASRRS